MNIDMKGIVKMISENEALKRDIIGISVLKDYLGHIPNMAQVAKWARMSNSANGLYNNFTWYGVLLCDWTDMRLSLPGDGPEHLIPRLNVIYRLSYKSDKMKVMTDQEYHKWVDLEKKTPEEPEVNLTMSELLKFGNKCWWESRSYWLENPAGQASAKTIKQIYTEFMEGKTIRVDYENRIDLSDPDVIEQLRLKDSDDAENDV